MLSEILRVARAFPRCHFVPLALRYISKETVLRFVNVILRVPSLFIAEIWLRTDPKDVKIPWLYQYTSTGNGLVDRAIQSTGTHDFVVTILYYLAIVLAVALAFLPLKKLITMYMYIVSGMLIVGAHYCSLLYVDEEKSSGYDGSILENPENLRRAGIHAAVQCIISAIIGYLLSLNSLARLTVLVYVLPVCARVINYPVENLHRVHNFASLFEMIFMTFFVFNTIPKVLDLIKAYLQKLQMAIQLYGWMPFILAVWFKVSYPLQFLVFWSTLLTVQLYKYLSVHEPPVKAEDWLVVMLASMAECVVTPVSLLGVCISISYIAFGMLTLTKLFLQGREALIDHGNIMQRGWTEGFTMFLLAIQTGLIEMKTSHRAFLMSIVLFIVLSSLIQSMYEITEPVLLGLGAAQSKNLWKHIRAILLSTFLWMFPLYMAFVICQFFDMDFWLMVVISSCLLTTVQVLGSLVTYSLFIYDSLCKDAWDNLDDVVFYTKSTTRVLEFIVAVFVVCYGLHESLFGEWSWVNGMILLVHCYVNVWQRLQTGWKSYLLRREAVKKVESLPDASPEQLAAHNDICSICYQEMQTAKVTACQHYFHGTCLRKWLYVQEKCPFCHQAVGYANTTEDEQNVNENNELIEQEADESADSDSGVSESHESEDAYDQATEAASETVGEIRYHQDGTNLSANNLTV